MCAGPQSFLTQIDELLAEDELAHVEEGDDVVVLTQKFAVGEEAGDVRDAMVPCRAAVALIGQRPIVAAAPSGRFERALERSARDEEMALRRVDISPVLRINE